MKSADGKTVSQDQAALKEIAECLVEDVITEKNSRIQRALVLAEKCSQLTQEQKSAFKLICLSLVADNGSADIIRLGHNYVVLHWKGQLRFRTSNLLKKKPNMDSYWTILPDPLLCVLTLQALLYLAEQNAELRGRASRAQMPGGYPRSVKRPYFRALKSSLAAAQHHFPEWIPNIRLLLLRDQRYEIFGWQPKPIARRKEKILSLFRKHFSSGDRIDTISRLQYIIFKTQNAISTESIVTSSIQEVLIYFSNHREVCATLIEEVAALLKKRCMHTYRHGLIKQFNSASFTLLKFADENLTEKSILLKRIHFGVNFDLGMAHLASKRGREAVVFFERSLELLDKICEVNSLINKYLVWFRHFIEAVAAQSRHENDIALICLRVCLGSLLEVGNLPRFKIPYIHKTKGGRWGLIWSGIIHARKRVEVSDEDQSVEFFELQEWSKLIGRDIIQTRQRFDFTVMYVERCLAVAKSGIHEMPINSKFVQRKCNIGEFTLPGATAMFHQMKQAVIDNFSKTSIEDIKHAYLDFVKNDRYNNKINGTQTGVAISALYTYQALVVNKNDEDAEILIIYALENFETQISSLSYSFANIGIECFRELATCLAISKNWKKDSFIHIVKLMESIFLNMELVRAAILDRDDRAYMEKALQSLYSDVANAFVAILERTKDFKLVKLLLKTIIVYSDRSKLRWLRSVFAGETAAEVSNLTMPHEIKSNFLAAEESLRLFYLTHANRFGSKFAIEESNHNSNSSERGLGFSTEETDNSSEEATVRVNFTELSQKYIAAIAMIRRYFPDFEGNFLRRIFLPIETVFRVDRDVSKLWIKLIGEQITFIFMAGKLVKYAQMRIYDSTEVIALCSQSRKQGSTVGPAHEVLTSIDFTQLRRMAKKVYGGSRGQAKRLMKIFVDSELAILSLETVLFPDSKFKFIYSPNASLSAGNAKPSLSIENILVVCPQSGLPLASLEGQMCWRGPRCLGRKYLVNEEIDELVDFKTRISCCTILHFIGHFPVDEEAKKGYLQFFDGIAIDLQWIAENIHFSNNPVVFLNLCRSGISFKGYPAEPFVESERYLFDSEFGREPVSYVSAFLSCGASAVIATTRPVEDFAAFLFGWKFSKLAQERDAKNVDDVFFHTLKWCRAIRREADLTAPLNDLEHCYFPDEVPSMKSKFHEALSKFLSDFPDNWTRSWDHFVIFR